MKTRFLHEKIYKMLVLHKTVLVHMQKILIHIFKAVAFFRVRKTDKPFFMQFAL
ncbi:hypothetical protein AB434_1049 [Heyndrickxia coagulans]|uniref:Uncharacterized protein n=1 Tax=Heyndrickxia coagulans TaxID=1398 RepID=A0AAN0WAB6_HEYCO|nr:hypothetical protein SB48_HM08orf00144 [Heyndrickxia coagulans]AKN53454.1 hypothetical protein AB434_1049 [Heyndrickxia coagulans]KYC88577.1 hypothetical protein B4096_1397 [Heyndrickxia coagulans]